MPISTNTISNADAGRLLDTKQAAKRLGVSPAFLERDRWQGPSIPYVRVGTRAVRYTVSALDSYVAKRAVAAVQKEAK